LGNSFRVFNVTNGAKVNISGLTVLNGSDLTGGGINNAATLTLSDCTIKENNTIGSGGGIQNSGKLTITRCTISNNVATVNGGGIYNTGTLTVNDSTISANTANAASSGGGIYNEAGGATTLEAVRLRETLRVVLAGVFSIFQAGVSVLRTPLSAIILPAPQTPTYPVFSSPTTTICSRTSEPRPLPRQGRTISPVRIPSFNWS
jgi:predicted outer membrane repeat protein